eukprot:603085-Pelagomonas_calceolata.AAC.3
MIQDSFPHCLTKLQAPEFRFEFPVVSLPKDKYLEAVRSFKLKEASETLGLHAKQSSKKGVQCVLSCTVIEWLHIGKTLHDACLGVPKHEPPCLRLPCGSIRTKPSLVHCAQHVHAHRVSGVTCSGQMSNRKQLSVTLALDSWQHEHAHRFSGGMCCGQVSRRKQLSVTALGSSSR